MVVERHEIPIVPADQGRLATVNNTADILKQVEQVIEDVFTTITARINESSTHLQDLSRRAAIAQAKVEKLTGANKATQVFSSAQYPGGEKYSPYVGLHSGKSAIPFKQTPIKSKEQDTFEKPNLQEKLQFYHVRERHGRNSEEVSQEDGLGRLPPHISTMSSLLLFNTSHNPSYISYVKLTSEGLPDRQKRLVSSSLSSAAPHTPYRHSSPITLQSASRGFLDHQPNIIDLLSLNLAGTTPSTAWLPLVQGHRLVGLVLSSTTNQAGMLLNNLPTFLAGQLKTFVVSALLNLLPS
ncbi:unnamed protein product, partial [Meganyctiphanes norvegica]